MKFIAAVCIDDDSANAAIADECGSPLARASVALGSIPPGHLRTMTDWRAAIEITLRAARAAARVPTPLDALVVGLSPYHEEVLPAFVLDGAAERYAILQLAQTAHIGALGGKPGIVVVAGTESIALGTDPTISGIVQAGGWGGPFGGDGGMYSIGFDAVRSALAVADRGEPLSRLGVAAIEFFAVSSLHELPYAYARGTITRERIAQFARVALDLATRIDWPAPGALDRDAFFVRQLATHCLVEQAMTVEARLPALPGRSVSYAGRIFEDAVFLEKFAWMLEMRRLNDAERRARENSGDELGSSSVRRMPTPTPRAPELGPVAPFGDVLAGSLLLARHLLGAAASADPIPATSALALLHT